LVSASGASEVSTSPFLIDTRLASDWSASACDTIISPDSASASLSAAYSRSPSVRCSTVKLSQIRWDAGLW
jgi:hypothetical protein